MSSLNSFGVPIIILPAMLSGCMFSEDDAALCSLPGYSFENRILEAAVEMDPYGIAPLTARLDLTIENPGMVQLTIKGKNGRDSDLVKVFSQCSTQHSIPVVGLYANHTNDVEIEILNYGFATNRQNLELNTGPAPENFPSFVIEKNYDSSEHAYFLVNFIPTNRPLIVDRYGEIRWYLDVEGRKFGIQRLRNGNIAFGLEAQNRVEEYSMLGEAMNTWPLPPEYEMIHHDVFEMNNGNFLVTVNGVGLDTIEDFILEIDRISGETITVWDLREILPRRYTFWRDEMDWFHTNAVIHDDRDDTIIVSGQRQGLVKVSRDNELRWILAPPDGWDGFEDYLLNSLPGEEIEWVWGQHAPLILPDGDILLFDNGFGREYGSGALYSRAVRYRIAESVERGGTVQQIWQYGKERGEDMYAPIVSDVDYLSDTDSILITAGSLTLAVSYVSPEEIGFQWIDQPEKARVIEVDADGNVAFQMLVTSTMRIALAYRAEKLSL